MVAESSESDFKSVVRKARVTMSLELKLCVVNEVFDSEVFVYPNRGGCVCSTTGITLQVLGVC